MNLRKATGDRAETIACRFLQKQGLRLLAKNFRCRRGEIDLIMQHREMLVFVEVRYRRDTRVTSAAESVSRYKRDSIIRCASAFLTSRDAWNTPARFDVVCLEGTERTRRLEWIRDAFRVE